MRECMNPSRDTEAQNSGKSLKDKPMVDIFVNPFQEENCKIITQEQQEKSEKFFRSAICPNCTKICSSYCG